MDTTSNALSRVFHLLAQNPDVQNKLRAEILEARGGLGGETDTAYDDLLKLPYLDAVCRETLRLYVPSFGRQEPQAHTDIRYSQPRACPSPATPGSGRYRDAPFYADSWSGRNPLERNSGP